MKIAHRAPSFSFMGLFASLLVVAAAGSLAGCADSSKLTYLPSGDAGFAINCCGGVASTSWAECYKKAGETCGSYGYDVISKDADNGATSGGTIAGIFGANIKNRSMVIRCKQ